MSVTTKTFDFDKAKADWVATTPPLQAEKDGMIKRVHEGVAEYYSSHPTENVTTTPSDELTEAVRRYDLKIDAANEQVYARYAEALQAARVAEARAVIDAGRTFLAAVDRFRLFETRRGHFLVICGRASDINNLEKKEEFTRALEAWLFGIERAIGPRPEQAQAPRVPLHRRIRELIAG